MGGGEEGGQVEQQPNQHRVAEPGERAHGEAPQGRTEEQNEKGAELERHREVGAQGVALGGEGVEQEGELGEDQVDVEPAAEAEENHGEVGKVKGGEPPRRGLFVVNGVGRGLVTCHAFGIKTCRLWVSWRCEE